MKTASFFTYFGPGRISIARYAPRNIPAGYRVYKPLAPGPWFNSVPEDMYRELYFDQLGHLSPPGVVVALHEPAAVTFQVIDVAGRVVSETQDRSWSPGRWSVTWDGRGRSGEKLAAGIYFVRMRVAGQPVGLMKFALLD
jgi:hypothetical protein